MKKEALTALLTLIVMVLFCVDVAESRNYELRKKTGDYDIFIKIDRNPPVLGDNNITIEIKDKVGRSVTDAQVLVNYWMPPMPGMPPMNYKTSAVPNGNLYKAKMDIIMTGPWNIDVKIKTHAMFSVKFNVDAR